MQERFYNENFDLLCTAILKQAVKDYKAALKRKNLNAAAKLEKFFLSDWGQMLSRGQGTKIISLAREETKNETHIPHSRRPVRCVETGVYYESANSAAKANHTQAHSIVKCARGTSKTAGGYHWEFVD